MLRPKTIRNADDLIAYLEAKAEKDGPDSMAAIMLANAKAKRDNPAHVYNPAILNA